MAIDSGFSHWKWWFSTLMLNYGQDWGFAQNGMSDVLRRLISLRRRSILWLWYISGLKCATWFFWENQSEEWTLCGLHACRPFPGFHFFDQSRVLICHLATACHSHVHFSTLYASKVNTLIGNWLIFPGLWRFGKLMEALNENPSWNLVHCSIGPGGFDNLYKPEMKTPKGI